MPTFEGPNAERIRAYMFDGGEGVWLCPGSNAGIPPCISPRTWEQADQSCIITEEEFDHAKRILKLEASDCAYV